jgi:hypothetical protein
MKPQGILDGGVMTALMLAVAIAKAQPVTLACGPTPENRVGSFVHFNESAGTAGIGTADDPPYYGGNGPATFSTTEIKWEYRTPADHARNTFVLNRLTGELDHLQEGGLGTAVSYCAVVQKAF